MKRCNRQNAPSIRVSNCERTSLTGRVFDTFDLNGLVVNTDKEGILSNEKM